MGNNLTDEELREMLAAAAPFIDGDDGRLWDEPVLIAIDRLRFYGPDLAAEVLELRARIAELEADQRDENGILVNAGTSWFCERCKVEVYSHRCQHCGKSKRERT